MKRLLAAAVAAALVLLAARAAGAADVLIPANQNYQGHFAYNLGTPGSSPVPATSPELFGGHASVSLPVSQSGTLVDLSCLTDGFVVQRVSGAMSCSVLTGASLFTPVVPLVFSGSNLDLQFDNASITLNVGNALQTGAETGAITKGAGATTTAFGLAAGLSLLGVTGASSAVPAFFSATANNQVAQMLAGVLQFHALDLSQVTGTVTAGQFPAVTGAVVSAGATLATTFGVQAGPSVFGVATGSSAVPAPIVASGTNTVPVFNGTSIAWGTLPGGSLSGTADTMPFFNASGVLTESTSAWSVDPTNVRWGSRISSGLPLAQVHLVDEAAAADRGLTIDENNASTAGQSLTFRKSFGTYASPAAVDNTAYLGRFAFEPYDGSNFIRAAEIIGHVTPGASVSTGSTPSEIGIFTGRAGLSDPYGGAGIIANARFLQNAAGTQYSLFGFHSLDVPAATAASTQVAGGLSVASRGITTIPIATTQSMSAVASGFAPVVLYGNGNDFGLPADPVQIRFARSQGTNAAPTALGHGSTLGLLASYGHDGTNYSLGNYSMTYVDQVATIGAGVMPVNYGIFPAPGVGYGAFPMLTANYNTNVTLGSWTALATNATAGFPFIPTMPGAPTGTPLFPTYGTSGSATSSQAPIVLDSLDNRFYAYLNGASLPLGQYTGNTVGFLKNNAGGLWTVDATAYTPTTRTVQGSGPILIGGGSSALDLSANRVWSLATNSVTYGFLQQGGALSIPGRAANSAGNWADISATAGSNGVFRESGSTLGFGSILESAVTNLTTDLGNLVPKARTLTMTAPMTCGGVGSCDLSADRTIATPVFAGGPAGLVPPSGGSASLFLNGAGGYSVPSGTAGSAVTQGTGPVTFIGPGVAATAINFGGGSISGVLALGNEASPTGTGFPHVTSSAWDPAARAVDLSGADVANQLKAASFPILSGPVTTAGGTLATLLNLGASGISGQLPVVDLAPGTNTFVLTTITGAAAWAALPAFQAPITAVGILKGTGSSVVAATPCVDYFDVRCAGVGADVGGPDNATGQVFGVHDDSGTQWRTDQVSFAPGQFLKTTSVPVDSFETVALAVSDVASGWPTAPEVLVSSGPTTGPVGDPTFELDPSTKTVSAEALAVNGVSVPTNDFFVGGHTTNGNRDRAQFFVGGGALGTVNPTDDSTFVDIFPSSTAIHAGVTGGIYATERIRSVTYVGTGQTIAEAASLYIDGTNLSGVTGPAYALHVASGPTLLNDTTIGGAFSLPLYSGGLLLATGGLVGVQAAPTSGELSYYTEITSGILASIISAGTVWLETSNSAAVSTTGVEYPAAGSAPTYAHLYIYQDSNTFVSGALVYSISKNRSIGGSAFCSVSTTSATTGVLDSGLCTISGSAPDTFGVIVASVSSPIISGTMRVTAKVRLSAFPF